MSYIFSVKIYVEADTTPTDLSIGLENGVFFWTMGDFEQSTPSYLGAKSVLTRDGISSIQKSVNVKRMGDVANIDGLNLSIDNTEKFWVKFISAFGDNVSLHGSRVEIREHLNLDLIGTLIFKGSCDLPSFSKSTYKIPVRSLSDARDSQLGLDITDEYKQETIDGVVTNLTDPSAIGKIVPISFGKLEKASFLKTGGKEEVLTIGASGDRKSVFPVIIGGTNNISCNIRQPINSPTDDGVDSILDLGNNTDYLYVKVVSGDGEGQIVRVDSIVQNTSTLIIQFVNNIYEPLVARGLVVINSAISFIRINGQYDADFWNCGGVKNSDGVDVVAGADVYNYKDEYKLLPNIAVDVDSSDLTKKNSLSQNPPLFDGDINKLKGFQFVQTNALSNSSDTWWFDLPSQWVYDFNKKMFRRSDLADFDATSTQNIGDTKKIDGSDPITFTSEIRTLGTTPYTINVAKVFEVEVPSEIPETFDSVHLLIHSVQDVTLQGSPDVQLNFRVKTQKWYSELESVYNHDGNSAVYPFRAVNYPLNYDTIGLTNLVQDDFWTALDGASNMNGYKQLELSGISTPDELRALLKVGVMLGVDDAQSSDISFTIKSCGFLFTNSTDISKKVYTRFNGRLYDKDLVFANGWTTNNLINDPVGALAHTKWLQNFTNESSAVVPSVGWGKYYPTGYDPLNKVADANGSYRHQDLNQLGWYGVELSKQITDRKDSSSKAISKDICNKFFLSTWVDKNGLENVTQIVQKTTLAITQTITQAEMISWGDRIEQDSRDIFCEPIVNFDYNVASKGFNSSISVTQVGVNLTTESDQANAVKGLDYLTDSSRANLWQRARALYTYYGVINEAPKVLSDNTWISKKDNAYWYLRKWLRFQGVGMVDGVAKVVPKNYFSFVVDYSVAIGWDIGTRINISLPNITDNANYESMIYSITRNVSASPPNVAVKVILFDLDVTEEIDVQDSFDVTLDTWQDSTSTLANNIQDEV
tara:strand:+ start:1207 stop:4161 length:2955 start_codon:yes stop_codon:yes gene_type:complete